MGIELPTPHGEQQGAALRHGESAPVVQSQETHTSFLNVENNTSERPAYQEFRNNPAGGGSTNQGVQKDVTNATTTMAASVSASQPVSLDDIPVVAADDDLIEKQWVDSIKRVIKETRDNPYAQGEAISRLQADYLQKRYGRTIGGENA